MPCPDPPNCPQTAPDGRCLFLLGTAATHDKIRRNCPFARIALDEAIALRRMLDGAAEGNNQSNR